MVMSLHFNISDRGASPVFQRLPTASRQVTFNTVSEASLNYGLFSSFIWNKIFCSDLQMTLLHYVLVTTLGNPINPEFMERVRYPVRLQRIPGGKGSEGPGSWRWLCLPVPALSVSRKLVCYLIN